LEFNYSHAINFRKKVVMNQERLNDERKKRIIAFMRDNAYRPLLFDELVNVLAVPKEDIGLFEGVLDELQREGLVFKTRKKRYAVAKKLNLVPGRLQGNERGFGFVIPDDKDEPHIFIPADSMNGAMHNDRVIGRVNSRNTGRTSDEGEVVKVIERANRRVIGTYEKDKRYGFLIPDNPKISDNILIPSNEAGGAADGQKVIVQIYQWPNSKRNARGRVVEVLGYADQQGVDTLSVIRSHNLRDEFPQRVLEEAEAIPDTVTPEQAAGRKDLRRLKTVTIDGEDAKDLDDAVSIQKLENGCYMLGVHIADVAHYVKEGSELDREAFARGTSVYLIDRVLPMLPPRISNGICSLNPGADRLALTVMMKIDPSGKVIDSDIFESVINTDHRMTYTDVYAILEENDEALKEKYKDSVDMFETMKELAMVLRNKRTVRGSLDLNIGEAKVILDDKGRPVDVFRYEITIANRIIEEFMIVCNETIAERYFWTDTPLMYRIHEKPDPEKMQLFAEFVHNLGYTLRVSKEMQPRYLQLLLEEVKGTREEEVVNNVMLRSLQKARYSHDNLGHFGLASEFYCHFTAPIRRYPDLMVHRIIKEEISGLLNEERKQRLKNSLPETAKHCSERERAAEEAERATADMKKAEYMKQRLGDVFEGVISDVTSFGMFVQLDNTIEGLVRVTDMKNDYYIYNEANYSLKGERTGKLYKIGDRVKVVVIRAEPASGQIDFILEQEMRGRRYKSRP
jgi:ribonuclease R